MSRRVHATVSNSILAALSLLPSSWSAFAHILWLDSKAEGVEGAEPFSKMFDNEKLFLLGERLLNNSRILLVERNKFGVDDEFYTERGRTERDGSRSSEADGDVDKKRFEQKFAPL